MNDRWERVTALFDAARLLDGSARGAFLEVACGGDGELRAEVEALLASDAGAGDFLAEPIVPELGAALRQPRALLEPGQVVKTRYRVEQMLSGGGQALVYRAFDELLHRPVVLKVLRAEGRRNRAMQARLREEMEALARIDHPGVVGILDTGELGDGSPFLAIQYIGGISLREALTAGRLEPVRIAAILRQIGAALGATHAAGIAHRDLKPENIMLQRLADGCEAVKLIDFGIAKIERSELQPHLTNITIAGTVRYMAPEQFEGKNLPEGDVYSLGAVACEMLCGQPDIRALPGSLGGSTRRKLAAALAFRPEDRPRNVREWADGLAGSIAAPPRYGRRTAIAAGLVLMAGGVIRFQRLSGGDDARIIEKAGAFDPLTEGFQIHNDLSGTVAENADKTEYDGWRVFSPRQGHYYRHLSKAQKRSALRRGWQLAAVMRGEEGMSFAGVDFAGYGKRFDVCVIARPGADLVRLPTQTLPSRQGIDIELPREVPIYRRYELNYDAVLGVATLWVDGKKLLGGYRGWSQFQEDWGLTFGTSVLGSERGVGTFQSVRFEINP
ncbi:MAG: serine/threonine protein kinase [Acidobacteriota bacterium]|nr:serine/threonine protein kinase [Acidobacteriota bacterium]